MRAEHARAFVDVAVRTLHGLASVMVFFGDRYTSKEVDEDGFA